MNKLNVKKLITCAAVAVVVTMSVPAFAQSYDPSAGSGNIVPGPKGGMQAGAGMTRPLYNYAPSARHHHERSNPRMHVAQ